MARNIHRKARLLRAKVDTLKRYDGAEKIVERFRGFDSGRSAKKHGLLEQKAAILVEEVLRINSMASSTRSFNQSLVSPAVKSIDLLERFVDASDDIDVIDSYMNITESIGQLKRLNCRDSIPVIWSKALDIADDLDLSKKSMIVPMLDVITASVGQTASVVNALNANEIFDHQDNVVFISGNGDQRNPQREWVVDVYLNRGLTAMGDTYSDRKVDMVTAFFDEYDSNLLELVDDESMATIKKNRSVVYYIRLNQGIAEFLGSGQMSATQLRERLKIGGIIAVEKIIGKSENGKRGFHGKLDDPA